MTLRRDQEHHLVIVFSLTPLIYLIILFVKTKCAVDFSHHQQNPPFKACEFLAFAFISSSDVDIPSASRRSARFLAIFFKQYVLQDTEPRRTDAGVVTVADAFLRMTFDRHISMVTVTAPPAGTGRLG